MLLEGVVDVVEVVDVVIVNPLRGHAQPPTSSQVKAPEPSVIKSH